MAEEGSFSPDGTRIAYVPFANHPESTDFQRGLKRYRGGTASPDLDRQPRRLDASRRSRAPTSNDLDPMWVGDIVYFLSDRNGPVDACSPTTRARSR